MRLIDLSPELLQYHTEGFRTFHRHVDTLSEANGVRFLCPRWFKDNGGPVGTHSIICWDPSVPQIARPGPGRWSMVGTGLHDLSLVAGSSSVLLTDGCRWHGFVENGLVRDA